MDKELISLKKCSFSPGVRINFLKVAHLKIYLNIPEMNWFSESNRLTFAKVQNLRKGQNPKTILLLVYFMLIKLNILNG